VRRGKIVFLSLCLFVFFSSLWGVYIGGSKERNILFIYILYYYIYIHGRYIKSDKVTSDKSDKRHTECSIYSLLRIIVDAYG
jgi:hypothetical protein